MRSMPEDPQADHAGSKSHLVLLRFSLRKLEHVLVLLKYSCTLPVMPWLVRREATCEGALQQGPRYYIQHAALLLFTF